MSIIDFFQWLQGHSLGILACLIVAFIVAWIVAERS